jgi:hypothetical protein
MDTKNNGTHGTREFIQIQTSVRIKIIHPVCVGVL